MRAALTIRVEPQYTKKTIKDLVDVGLNPKYKQDPDDWRKGAGLIRVYFTEPEYEWQQDYTGGRLYIFDRLNRHNQRDDLILTIRNVISAATVLEP